jgi:hypothetical protein
MVFDERKFKNRLPRATSSSTWRGANRRPGRQKSPPKSCQKDPGACSVNIPAKNLKGVGGGLVDSIAKVAACVSLAAIAMRLFNAKAGEARRRSGATHAVAKQRRLVALPRKSLINIRASSAALSFSAARKNNDVARIPAGPHGSRFAPNIGTTNYLPHHAEIHRATIDASATVHIALRLVTKGTCGGLTSFAKTRRAEKR